MKYAILVGDGMADYPIEQLGGKTPLEAAYTPNMDFIAKYGVGGLVHTIPEGKLPGSDIANIEILGYDTSLYFTGRAPLEAVNMGVHLDPTDVAFRCNLITTKDGHILDYSAGHISTEEATEIMALISEKLGSETVRFYPGIAYRHLTVIKDGPVRITTVPPHDIMGQEIEPNLPQGEGSAFIRKLMADSVAILKDADVNQRRIQQGKFPASQIWLWGSGRLVTFPSFKERFGLSGAVISAVNLINGIGICAGLEVITVPGITGYLDTNYLGKAEYGLRALTSRDLIFIHVEAPDEAGHNGDVAGKIKAIEDFDRWVVGTMLEGLKKWGDFRIMVLPDHRTPLAVRTHTSEPVPVALFPTDQPDDMAAFSEREAEKGSLQVECGHRLIESFIDP